MAPCIWHVVRRPRTTNEKRHNAGLCRCDAESGAVVKARLRTGKTSSRLADVRDDKIIASLRDRSRGKTTHSAARKARERERWSGISA